MVAITFFSSAVGIISCLAYAIFSLMENLAESRGRNRELTTVLIDERVRYGLVIAGLRQELKEEKTLNNALVDMRAVESEMDLLDEIDEITGTGGSDDYELGI